MTDIVKRLHEIGKEPDPAEVIKEAAALIGWLRAELRLADEKDDGARNWITELNKQLQDARAEVGTAVAQYEERDKILIAWKEIKSVPYGVEVMVWSPIYGIGLATFHSGNTLPWTHYVEVEGPPGLPKLYSWSKVSGYDVTGSGDRRFSAFYARLDDGRSIEEHYQCDVKGYDPGGRNWRLGKGRPPLKPTNLWEAYLGLWKQWAAKNDKLLERLELAAVSHDYTLRDRFATSDVNQANALATILNERLMKK